MTARRIMIEIARRRRSRGTGTDVRAQMSASRNPLAVNVPRLFAGIPYLVVGDVATRSYMPERFTKDVDILVPAQSLEEAFSHLRAARWKNAGALRFPDSSLGLSGSLWQLGDEQIDLISSNAEWVIDATSKPNVDASGAQIIALPFLVLMKLDSGRAQDTADISRMLALADAPTVEAAREVIRRYCRDNETVEDFESLLEIGRWELGRG